MYEYVVHGVWFAFIDPTFMFLSTKSFWNISIKAKDEKEYWKNTE